MVCACACISVCMCVGACVYVCVCVCTCLMRGEERERSILHGVCVYAECRVG